MHHLTLKWMKSNFWICLASKLWYKVQSPKHGCKQKHLSTFIMNQEISNWKVNFREKSTRFEYFRNSYVSAMNNETHGRNKNWYLCEIIFGLCCCGVSFISSLKIWSKISSNRRIGIFKKLDWGRMSFNSQ